MRNPLRLGSLCTGYGGLDLGVGQVLGVEHTWHAELDPDAGAVLAAHWPGVPNLGDLRGIDWAAVEPVDVLTAGFPCQPVSAAGRRKGINDERWLWDDIHRAVGRMDPRPRVLVLENVAGLLTANRGHAMARVIHGLAQLGYVGRYRLLRASDIGAAHRRERWFCTARLAAPDAESIRHGYPRPSLLTRLRTGALASGAQADGVDLLPTPTAADSDRTSVTYVRGNPTLVGALLPTPRATDGTKGGPNQRGSSGDLMLPSAVVQRWGDYGPAISRWEAAAGRPAPEPTEPGRLGKPRLAPRFVEWLMGLPAGWVTDHLPRNPALRVLGNGVVPAQAAAAVLALSDTRPYPTDGAGAGDGR